MNTLGQPRGDGSNVQAVQASRTPRLQGGLRPHASLPQCQPTCRDGAKTLSEPGTETKRDEEGRQGPPSLPASRFHYLHGHTAHKEESQLPTLRARLEPPPTLGVDDLNRTG